MNTPVLFVVFNRPEDTRKTFSAIRDARPQRLYIAADGPRKSHPDDRYLCEEVKKVFNDVDWECDVKTLYRDENLGCSVAVSSAIDWFFKNEEQGIILEDDCLADSSWFQFASQMLDRYQDNHEVMCVCANHFSASELSCEHSYYFSIYNYPWGWASWRRAWSLYDRKMHSWPAIRNTDWLLNKSNYNYLFQYYWRRVFDRTFSGGYYDTWHYQWLYACWLNNGLIIHPCKNLVINIGFNDDATHTSNAKKILTNLPLHSMNFPLSHPPVISQYVESDNWDSKHRFKLTYMNFLLIALRKYSGFQWVKNILRARFNI